MSVRRLAVACQQPSHIQERTGCVPKFQGSIHLISASCTEVPPADYGGIERVIAQLGEGLIDLGINVLVYSAGTLGVSGALHVQTLPNTSEPFSKSGSANSQAHLMSVLHGLRTHYRSGDIVVLDHPDHYRFLRRNMSFVEFAKFNMIEVAHWTDAGAMRNWT